MKDPDNIDWEREGCLGCKQRGACGMTYRLDNGEPVNPLTHEDVEHVRAEIHLEHHFWHAPSFKPWAWEEAHPGWSLALHVVYAILVFILILGLAVIA